jgi:hypothetical protein
VIQRLILPTAILVCLATGCSSGMKTKEKVREGLMTHLQNAGFNTRTLEVDVAKVTFEKNLAHASVSFRPLGSTNIHDAMVMNYAMEIRDGHWVVTGRSDSGGHGMGQAMAGAGPGGALPAGHPQVSTRDGMGGPAVGTQPQINLPPGHPSLDSMPPANTSAQPLPPGHPNFAKPAPSTAPATPSGTPQSRLKSPGLERPGYWLDYRNEGYAGKAETTLGSAGLAACATNWAADSPCATIPPGEVPALWPTGLAA